MHERDEFAVRSGGHAEALLGARAMAHALEHHVASQYQLAWPVEVTRCRGGNHAMCPGPKLSAKTRAKKAGDHAHVFLGNPKHLCHHILMVADGLRGLVEGEVLSVPHGNTSVQFDWI